MLLLCDNKIPASVKENRVPPGTPHRMHIRRVRRDGEQSKSHIPIPLDRTART